MSTTYARISTIYADMQGRPISGPAHAAEIVVVPDGQDITQMFHPSIQFVACDNTVKVGYLYTPPSTFTAPAISPPSKADLIGYATWKQKELASGSVQVNIAASGPPVMVEASMDATSLIQLLGAAGKAQANSGATFNWVQTDGSSVTLTAAQVLTIDAAVTAFTQATYDALSAVISAINSGTVTTTAQVDAFASPAWPVNS